MPVKGVGPALPTGIVIDRDSAVTIAAQLAEQLTWLIATGALAPGDRMPSIRDLGAELGIHHHTVRQAYLDLDSRELITVRRGTPATVREFTGLWPARPPYGGAMRAQGVLIAAHTPFYLPLIRGIERGGAEAGVLTIVAATDNNIVRSKLQMRQFVTAGVRGIIAVSMGRPVYDEVGQAGAENAIHAVYCDQPTETVDSFRFDEHGAGHELASHLAGHGHRRVAFMTPSLDYPNMASLYRGFTQAVQDGVLEGVDVVKCDDFSLEAGAAAARTALTSTAPPSAIATVADELAIGVIDAARTVGANVPDDLALVSYGAIDAGAYVDPPITTIALPAEQMGLLAARRLAARIRGDRPEGTTYLPGRLIVRASCGRHDPESAMSGA
ncbi:substrate-binding domain-containing protein [Intrasporangium sp.]|jgi:DNA-binding LacI/PurR family transcriptional regulator|uniref:substrate-binding domain-containing protein n=1 Tax=Intrasporangium sp. TaxID=1925024 RepID=UPI003365A201